MATYYVGNLPASDSLYHHGIKGQKWGVRRYQNPDGTLTEEGRKRYITGEGAYERSQDRLYNSYWRQLEKQQSKQVPARYVEGKDGPNDFSDDSWKYFYNKREAYVKDLMPKRQEYSDALRDRNRNKNPFLAKQKYEKMKAAEKELTEAYDKATKNFVGESLASIDSLPKSKREQYESYVYELLGWDW